MGSLDRCDMRMTLMRSIGGIIGGIYSREREEDILILKDCSFQLEVERHWGRCAAMAAKLGSREFSMMGCI